MLKLPSQNEKLSYYIKQVESGSANLALCPIAGCCHLANLIAFMILIPLSAGFSWKLRNDSWNCFPCHCHGNKNWTNTSEENQYFVIEVICLKIVNILLNFKQ